MNHNPYESPRTAGESPARLFGISAGGLVKLLAVVGVIGIVIAFFLPAVRNAREPARRIQCVNNLKQIALALRSYESAHHGLPPAYTVDAEGKPLHSWRTLILPHLEQQALYEKIDLSKPWDDPANKDAYETSLSVYKCPALVGPATHTAYFAVVASNGCFRPTEPRKLAEITDDLNLTLMVIELAAGSGVHWMSPTDANEQSILQFGTAAKLPHTGGVLAAFVGGEIQFLGRGWDAATLRALITIDGNDDAVVREAN